MGRSCIYGRMISIFIFQHQWLDHLVVILQKNTQIRVLLSNCSLILLRRKFKLILYLEGSNYLLRQIVLFDV